MATLGQDVCNSEFYSLALSLVPKLKQCLMFLNLNKLNFISQSYFKFYLQKEILQEQNK